MTHGLIDVFGFQIRIMLRDLLTRCAGSQQPEQPRYWKAQTSDARLARIDRGIDCYATERHIGSITKAGGRYQP
jgi:hypothetical protein